MSDYEYVYIPLTTDELRQEAIDRNVKRDMDYRDRDVCIWHVETQQGWYRKSTEVSWNNRLTIPTFKEIDHLSLLISLGMTSQEIQDYYDNK